MVQYAFSRTGNDYWKLQEYIYSEQAGPHEPSRGFVVPLPIRFIKPQEGISVERLTYERGRKERGLIDYSTCTLEELRKFATGRGVLIPGPHSTRGARGRFVLMLEEADESATFERFLELPAELRFFVYEWHFKGLSALQYHRDSWSCLHHAPPPITQGSRQIRQESLPFFVAKRFLDFDIISQPKSSPCRITTRGTPRDATPPTTTPSPLLMNSWSRNFIVGNPACAVLTRRFCVKFRDGSYNRATWQIEWDRKEGKYVVELDVEPFQIKMTCERLKASVRGLDERLREVFDGMGRRGDGERGMKMSDFESLMLLDGLVMREDWKVEDSPSSSDSEAGEDDLYD